MATRRKRGLPESPSEGESKKKKRTSAKTVKARAVEEELQNVGADVVPSVTIDVAPTLSRPAPAGEPAPRTDNRQRESNLSDQDLYLFNEGSHHKLWQKLGAHIVERDGVLG